MVSYFVVIFILFCSVLCVFDMAQIQSLSDSLNMFVRCGNKRVTDRTTNIRLHIPLMNHVRVMQKSFRKSD